MNLQDRIFKATEYGIDTIRDMKVNRPIWEDNQVSFTGKEVYKMIIDIHETYLKLLKGEKDEEINKNKR